MRCVVDALSLDVSCLFAFAMFPLLEVLVLHGYMGEGFRGLAFEGSVLACFLSVALW